MSNENEGKWNDSEDTKSPNARSNPLHLKSQPISLTDFYSDSLLDIPKEYDIVDDAAALQQAEENMQLELGISAQHMDSLRADCSVAALMCPNEPVVLDNILGVRPMDSVGLETIRRWRLVEQMELRHPRKMFESKRRLSVLPKDLSYLNSREQGSSESVGTSYHKETLLTVLIMKPLKKLSQGTSQMNNCKTMQRFQVLGRQTLADLKDRIICLQDEAVLGDCSECLGNVRTDVAKEMYPSSYFFINGTFYNDLRHPTQQDLARPVIEWIQSSDFRRKQWGEVASKTMDGVHFREITICIGEPYLYVHQGNCEHIIIFSDLRMLGPHDCQDPSRYPLLTGYSYDRGHLCKICHQERSKWSVVDCDLLPEEPCFLCETCLRMFLYEADGRKKYPDFKVYAIGRSQAFL